MGSNLLRKLYNRSVELRTDLNSVTVPKCLETQKQNRQRAGKLSRIEIVKSSSRWNPWSGIDWDSSNSNSSSRQFDKSQHPGKINIEDGKRRMKQSAARHLVIYLTNIYSPSVVHISTKTTKMLLLMVLLLLGKWTFFGKDHTHRHTVRSVVLRAQAGTCTQAHTHTLSWKLQWYTQPTVFRCPPQIWLSLTIIVIVLRLGIVSPPLCPALRMPSIDIIVVFNKEHRQLHFKLIYAAPLTLIRLIIYLNVIRTLTRRHW